MRYRYAQLYEHWDHHDAATHKLKGERGNGMTWCGLDAFGLRAMVNETGPFIGASTWESEEEQTTCSACCAILGIDREPIPA